MLDSAKRDGAERSSEWTEALGGERLTGALLDRLTHHVHILEMNGESYRLAQSKRRRRTAGPPADIGPPAAQQTPPRRTPLTWPVPQFHRPEARRVGKE